MLSGLRSPALRRAGSSELKRTWKTGDAITITLPKTLRLEPLPDNPRRVAILWGPLVLAGDLGPEEGRRRGRRSRRSARVRRRRAACSRVAQARAR